jgi:hypothetical protein
VPSTSLRFTQRTVPKHIGTCVPRWRGVVEKRCPNRDCCEYNIMLELPAWEEFGRLFLNREDEAYCRECGEEMIDP